MQAGTRRIQILSGAFILIALIFVARLFSLQIIHGSSYDKDANKQYVTAVGDLFDRGSIFFKKKDGTVVSGATVSSGFKIVINPSILTDSEQAYAKLSAIVAIDRETFILRANKKSDTHEEVAYRLTQENADAVSALKIKGVKIEGDNWRFNPGGRLAAHVLGFMSYSGDIYTGRYGLERSYNDVLASESDKVSVNFFAEIFSNIRKTIFSSGVKEGDIITTIEPTVQAKLEQGLRGIIAAQGSIGAGGVVIDPKTGAIIAMAYSPDFDLNNFGNEKNIKTLSNPIIENVFEMGSIIKPLTMAAGLDAGVVTPETTYNDMGYAVFNTERINNYDRRGRGVVSMQEVLNQSLNTGVAFVMQKLGKERFRDYMLSYGIGEKTGIDLPNEAQDLVANLQSPREIEYATASFGQGIALSPIATVRALSVLANGGILIHPHLVERIEYKDGTSKNITFPPGKQVLKKESFEDITRMLVAVVDDALLGGTVKIKNYSVAAKTGTAQMAKEDGRGYYEDKYLHSLFGYFPAYDAKFLIFMFTIDPREQYASHSLGPPFIDMTKFIINYYQIPPDR